MYRAALRPGVNSFKLRTASHSLQAVRNLNVHEYQGAKIMSDFGVRVPHGVPAGSPEEAATAATMIKTEEAVIKCQVHAGGRGLGALYAPDDAANTNKLLQGGVHKIPKGEVQNYAEKMLGKKLVTKQTGAAGRVVSKVFVCETIAGIKKEMYFAILMDRATQGPMLVGSPCGGVNIEDVAATQPEMIFKEYIDIVEGIQPEHAERMAKNLGFTEQAQAEAAEQIKALYKLFIETDATQVEINPLIEDGESRPMCLDAKLGFDGNAEFRQKDIFALRDITQEDAREVKASEYDINYIALDGSIACMVNGAGLAMATMDVIKLHGAEPANFLDLGGGASEKQVTLAFELLNADPKVKAILVNIFGGIMRCDIIANGIVEAAKTISLRVPLIVRLEGTNVEEGKRILAESDVKIIVADDLDDGAKKAVAASSE